MDANLLPSSSSSPFSSILIFILFLTISQKSSSINGFSSCNNQIGCGNLTNVGFPFWGDGRPDACGYPHLRLDCDKNITTIDISNVKYQVLELNLSTQILKIARSDLLAGSCASMAFPTVLDPTLFEYAPGYGNLSISYDCSSGVFTPCSSSGDNVSSTETKSVQSGSCSTSGTVEGVLTRSCSSSRVVIQPGSSCNSSITIGVSKIYDPDAGNYSRIIQKALREGFEVKYKVDIDFCSGCSGSGGVCGYGLESMKPTCYCANQDSVLETCLPSSPKHKAVAKSFWKRTLVIGISAAVVGVLLLIFAIILCIYKRKCSSSKAMIDWNNDTGKDFDVETSIRNYTSFVSKRYSYSHVKKMTNSFAEVIGKGGFGCVYKGALPDGRHVAVKVLNDSKSNGEDFMNEVKSMVRTSHVNIVTLLGFCNERKKRALIYDFMPNGSLDKFIFNQECENASRCLDWKTLYEIALGIARGLEYLHRGCNTRILHFDIKPQNILLDKDFVPKISDFGLAKLWLNKDSIVSMMGARGTAGYIAPEVFSRTFGGVSHKSDVYSYGMLVFEMVGGRRNIDPRVSHTSEIYFPHWIYEDVELGKDLTVLGVTTEEENELARKMLLVSFWCIQTNPSDRPPMSKVVDMLEGNPQQVQIPPKPFLFSPTRSPQQSTS